jgi:3-oxoacyl-[acyl-carrier protein] reductase
MDTKYALVTGGSRGIGRACVLKLAGMGYHTIINYVSNEQEALKTLELLTAGGLHGELLQFDVADKTATEQALKQWMDSHEGAYIEVLVNNAGIRKDNLMFWMTDEEWDRVLATSLNGTFYVSRFLVKYMLHRKHGRIINIVSLSGLKGMPGQANYSAAKAGIIGLTRALAQEVAKKKVTVNAVAPGFIDTDMTHDLPQEELKKLVPAGRFGQPEEVAELVGFLASSQAAYITGEVISINGGL